MAALAIVAAAAPTPATASTLTATSHHVLAGTCEPSSGTKTFLSWDEYSKGNLRLCATVGVSADGTKTIHAGVSGDFFYYWGAAWYDDCPSYCVMDGAFKVRMDQQGEVSFPSFTRWTGRNGNASYAFPAESGHYYRINFYARKYGGYWRDDRYRSDDTRDEMFPDLTVGVYVS
ncbi:hypothetical protein AB0J71_49725 [Nonomuraea sp. NPDC049637]|uniref:hypothetical protein n=1 Tax=Nonomuraea sp. NPDC049637 TaxID=3154356 RepID=UPI0034461D71